MIDHPAFSVGPWTLQERRLDLDMLAQGESVFALGNGHLGLRGNLDEGAPSAVPGTYLNGLYELRPLPYAEAGYGYPDCRRSVVHGTAGKPLRHPPRHPTLDARYGERRGQRRVPRPRPPPLTRPVGWG